MIEFTGLDRIAPGGGDRKDSSEKATCVMWLCEEKPKPSRRAIVPQRKLLAGKAWPVSWSDPIRLSRTCGRACIPS